MNMKRLVGTLALSIAALVAAPRAQAAAGNITAIYPVDKDSLLRMDSPVSSVDEPLVAGDVVCFAIDMSPNSPDDVWRLHYIGTGSEATESLMQPFAIGIYVSGVPRYARCFDSSVEGNTTTFYFKYEVTPGDLALPVVLAVGQNSPKPANATDYRDLEYNVLKSSQSRWVIDNSTADGAAATEKAVLSFMPDMEDADYDLRGAGFYVKTVGFDDDQEEDAWRSVAAGTKTSGVIHVDPTPTNTVTLYVWSMDDSIVKVDGLSKSIFVDKTTKEPHSVATIKIKAYVQDYTFTFTGGSDAAGKETQLVLSGSNDFSYNNATGERYVDYQTATVKVTTPPDPYMTITDADGNQQISLEANTNSITTAGAKEMRLKFSKAYTAGDVKVTLKQQVGGVDVDPADDYQANRYFAILLTQDNDPTTATYTDSVTVKAGETEARFYVFPLGTTTTLKSPGVTLVPDVSDQSQEVRAFFAAGVANQKSATIKITDQMPEVSVNAPSSGYKNDKATIEVSVTDNWRDLQTVAPSDWNKEGYTVKVRIGGQEVLSTNHVAFTDGTSKSFEVLLPAEGHPLTGTVQVWDATHGNSSSDATFEIDVDPARTATPVFYPTSDMSSTNENLKAYEDGHYFAEGETPYFRVTLTSDAAQDMYAFLVPANAAASNCVSCTAYSNGLFIASGTRTSSAATITFLDGYSAKNPMRARFNVELRSAEYRDDPDSVSYASTYSYRSVELACTNVSPTIVENSMEVNGTQVENGGTLGVRIPAGAQISYKARLNDYSDIDKNETGNKAIYTRWRYTDGLDGAITTLFVTNVNGRVSCPITFGTADSTQKIQVWARDKDDRSTDDINDIIDWGDCLYTFYVKISDTPHVTVSRDVAGEQTSFSFSEDVTDKLGAVYVTLSERPVNGKPAISAANPLVVELEVESYGTDGVLKLATNRVEFTDTATVQKLVKLDVGTLNGQYLSQFTIKAHVVTDTENAYGQKWCDYYEDGEADVTINNVLPTIVSAKRTNGAFSSTSTNTCIAGEAIAIHWQISDIPADVTNGRFTITWTLDPSSESPTKNPTIISNLTDKAFKFTERGRAMYVEGDYAFTVPMINGQKVVEMKVEDGDGTDYTSLQWAINVVKTTPIYVHVHGPESSSQTKYRAAKGVGQGVVAAKGATQETTTGFSQNWVYSESSTYAELYAWAYPSTNVWDRYIVEHNISPQSDYLGIYEDKGKFPTVLNVPAAQGVALTPGGNSWTAGAYYNWSTMGGEDSTAGDYDNYFYRWVMINPSEGEANSGEETGITKTDALPTTFPLTRTFKNVSLDSGNEAPVEVEAVFSREMFVKDNLGDINADYIPDVYVQFYGIGSGSAGVVPEDDLTSQRDNNDDQDYFPNPNGATYSTLIPSLPSSWTSGQPFTARYEIRGYGDGLNDAPQLVGIKNYKMDPNYTNEVVELRKAARDYTELEMLAWSLTGYDVEWSPECPSDPTMADTDEDGFADGYEYYFWYRAHVGDPEYFKTTGILRRLTGRRFDPKNPGVGTIITSEEIEAAMNPRVAYGDGNGHSGKNLDSDNDGLPDLLEYEIGTNPFDFDTDGDGLPDGWEIMIAGLDPLTSQTYVGEVADTLLNLDKDAMAISSYELEQSQLPKPTDTAHAQRWTFAVLDEDGDTDGVQWYAMAKAPATPVQGEACTNGWKLTTSINGQDYTFFSAYEDDHTNLVAYADEDGVKRLGETIDVRMVVEHAEGAETVAALGYPYTLTVGTEVTVEDVTEANPVYPYVIAEEIGAADANACWIYGKGSANTEMGEVAETANSYGCLALARQKAVPKDAEVVAFPSLYRDVAFLHYLCYQEFGFDPRTAWSAESPTTARWAADNDEGVVATPENVGYPARTRAYTAYDEFLVYSFFLCNSEDGKTLSYTTGLAKASDDDEVNVSWADAWYALTTNPNGPTDSDLSNKANGSTTTETTTSGHYYGRSSTNGADTDGDGVPDGWELYVMAGPKTPSGAYVFAPPYDGFSTGIPVGLGYAKMPKSYLSPFVDSATSADTCNATYMGDCDTGLNEFKNYQGLDSIAVYTNVSTSVKFESGYKWFNKFFPTDPWAKDTDGDGLADSEESKAFYYGTFATTLVDDGKKQVFPGGGLNPCSVDTDCDGLPDPWEFQFAGTTGSIVAGEESSGLRDGMDGTVSDAYTTPGGINRDYDNDGLENWQEYLTGTMRCWRYDDPISPLTYIPYEAYYKTVTKQVGGVTIVTEEFDPEYAAKNLKAAGYLDTDDVNEFWYKTLVDATSAAYNPGLVTDMSSGAQYFSRVTNPWDLVYVEPSKGGAYYWFYDRVNDASFETSWKAAWMDVTGFSDEQMKTIKYVPEMYACCSPIDPDSDHDGMDDYYEIFHGMNPLLGQSGVAPVWKKFKKASDDSSEEPPSGMIISSVDPVDLVYDSLGGLGKGADTRLVPQAWGEGVTTASFMNYWQFKAEKDGVELAGNGYDFVAFPWLNGSVNADPDGDGIRNQEESIMPLVSPQTAWHHTDPTPLWMTDATYSNSLVRMFYCLPTRGETFKIEKGTFTHTTDEGVTTTYDLANFGCFNATDDGLYTVAFNPDSWTLVASPSARNYFASFEQNEGYDSDHDGLMDQDELGGKYNGKTDPLDADSPKRRQAMYFQGPAKPSILQTMPFACEYHPLVSRGGRYPDDMSFLQFTVECWVKAESLDDSTIIERMIEVDRSSPDDQEYLRRNFSIGIKGGKWQALFDPNDTTKQTVEVLSQIDATTDWTHIAVTYDMSVLKIFVNGKPNNKVTSSLQPTYGSSAVAVSSGTQLKLKPGVGRTGMSYWADIEYSSHAIVVGAAFRTMADGMESGTALDITGNTAGFDAYKNFYTGYVDEIRIWDGARTEAEIVANYAKRFTSTEAKDNREDFYEKWSANSANDVYRGRYAKDGSGNAYDLPAELRFHWAFDSVFGGASEGAVAKAPAGFDYLGSNIAGDGARALRSRPENYEITWWKAILDGYGSVYDNKAWICWIPNTVTHLPRYDGTTLDSVYWSEDFKGAESANNTFTRTAEPVSLWYQVLFNASDATSYLTTGTRHKLVNDTDAATSDKTSFATLYEFTGRHLNQCGDDMLALGGAYAKHIDEMWDQQGPSVNWEVAGSDQNGNGLPDWWEAIAEDLYRDDVVTGSGDINWTTQVRWPDQNGSVITAGEAYLRDLARGYHGDKNGDPVIDGEDGDFVQRADENGNSIPDWWEKMYQIEGEDAFADHDNDGLCNLVEYVLSERFNLRDANGARLLFNPTIACSVMENVPDYFFKIGDLYVGDIFADHDFIEDAWERQYAETYASPLVYDVKTDNDDDGWSAFAEARYSQQVSPINADGSFHFDETGAQVVDYPIPTLQLQVKYNGSRSADVRTSPIGVYISRDLSGAKTVDASYYIKGEAVVHNTQTGDTTTNKEEEKTCKRYLGKWSDRQVYGTLAPGFVKIGTIEVQAAHDPSTVSCTWSNGWFTTGWYCSGTRTEYLRALHKYGSDYIQLLTTTSGYEPVDDIVVSTDLDTNVSTLSLSGKKVFGTVDMKTGEYELDLGVLKGGHLGSSDGDGESFEDLYYLISYQTNPSTELPRDLYLGEADTGYVREGKNQVFVWVDLDNDGAFTIGEPCGYLRDVDIGWRLRKAEVEVFDHSPILPRVKVGTPSTTSSSSTLSGEAVGASSNSASKASGDVASTLADRGKTIAAFCAELKERVVEKNLPQDRYTNEMQKIEWMNTNLWKSPTVDENATELTRVRIVRWALNGRPVYDAYADPEVVFDKKMRFANRKFLTEADILADGDFDIDWKNLENVVNDRNVLRHIGNVTNVSYLVVLGDGKTYWDDASDTNSCPRILDCVLERRFTCEQPIAETYSPKKEGFVVYASHPTFSWTITDEDDDRYDGCTAFDIQILEVDSDTVVWDSGTQLLPPRDSYGRYIWEAPAYVGDDLQKSVNYRWRVSVMNAKFPTPSWSSASDGYFRIEPEALGLKLGKIAACVRYFGPRTTVLNQGTVCVEAFVSPDFTGLPAARVTVPTSEYDAIASSDSNQVAQAMLLGLPFGTYYVRAYIDSDQYGTPKTHDDWESWGYYCTRDGSTSEIFKPVKMEVGGSRQSDVCVVYIEDADTNGNRIPDAYEMHMNGGSLDDGTENLGETLHCGLAINTDLVSAGDLDQATSSADDYTGYIAHVTSGLSSRGIAALAAGVRPSSLVVDANGNLVAEATVEDGTFAITDVAFDKDAGKVTLTLDAKVEKNATTASIYKLTSVLTVKVLRTETLAGEWQEVARAAFTVTGDSLDAKTVTVSDLNLTTTSGFFKVVVE